MRNQGLLLAAVLAMGLVACGDDEPARNADRDRGPQAEETDEDTAQAQDNDAEAEADPFAEEGEPAPRGTPTVLIDSDAVAMMAAFDDHIVAAAKLVQARGADVRAKALAKDLETTHASHRGKVARLERSTGPVAAHDEVDALEEGFAAQLATIDGSVDGAPLDVAFLEAVIASHTEVLALLDGQLVPGARADAVREHLGVARTAVAADLDKAQALLSDY